MNNNVKKVGIMETVINAALALAIFWIIGTFISARYDKARQEKERKRWKKYKTNNKCIFIGIDESGFWGKKYIWKTKDGNIITNNHKN